MKERLGALITELVIAAVRFGRCNTRRHCFERPLFVDCVEKLRLISVRCADSFSWAREIRPMMGERRVMQEALFYGFSLERHVPDNHLLRRIDRFVDLSEVRTHLEPYYSETGRPSIDPELMIRMLIVGYCFGIRSERRLCDEVHLNLAYRWFC